MGSNSKSSILSAIRANNVATAELPSLEHDWIEYADPIAQFATVLDSIGGACEIVNSIDEVSGKIRDLPVIVEAKQVVNLVSGVSCDADKLIDSNAIDDPHRLADVDVTIFRAELGVAENASLWVTDAQSRHRVVYFLSQHLIAIVPASTIVNNMHEAYEKLSFDAARFGMFIAGPSKTADIEQSLVIGAHGSRSMMVYVVRDA